jgi:hypothetical protein
MYQTSKLMGEACVSFRPEGTQRCSRTGRAARGREERISKYFERPEGTETGKNARKMMENDIKYIYLMSVTLIEKYLQRISTERWV